MCLKFAVLERYCDVSLWACGLTINRTLARTVLLDFMVPRFPNLTSVFIVEDYSRRYETHVGIIL